MTVQIHTRPLSQEERQILRSPALRFWIGALFGSVGRFVLFFLLAIGLGLSLVATLDAMMRKGQIPEPAPWLMWPVIIGFWGCVLLIPAYLTGSAFRHNYRQHQARRADLQSGTATLIEIDTPRFLRIVDKQGSSTFLIEVDAGSVLALDAERLAFDLELFGIPEPSELDEQHAADTDEDEEHWPECPPFPCERFTLHWLPATGRLLSIEAAGAAASPERVLLDNEIQFPERQRLNSCRGEAIMIQRSLDSFQFKPETQRI